MADENIILNLEANDNASQKIDNVTKSMRNMEKEANNIDPGAGISKSLKGFEDGLRKFNSGMRSYNTMMSGLNHSVIRGVREMGSAIYDFTSESINNFTNFSEQHAKTLGAMAADYDKSAESQAKFFQNSQKLKDQAMQIGTFGVNGNGSLTDVTGVSEAQTELVKAGVSDEDILNTNALSDVLEFAQANQLSTEQAVDFAVTLGNQFGVDRADWGLMLDKVSHTADMSVIDVADIVQSMKWAGGITSGLDRDLEETLGLISILGDFGLKGSQAGTGIQALMTRLLTGDTTVITDAQAAVAPGNALEKFYEFEKIAKPDGNLLPMADVVEELDATMSDMTDEEQAWFAKKLFGLYQMKSAYALLNGDESDLEDVIKEIREQSEGTNENKLSLLLASQYGQLTSLGYLWEGIKTDIGDRVSVFVSAIRTELFNFLKSNGNYDINFDNLELALDEACNLIEERYGSAVADAIRSIGGLTIDLAQIAEEVGPELGNGLLQMLGSLADGDVFGAMNDWGDMIDNMHSASDGLPEDLQGLSNAIIGTIDWFGKLMVLNVATEIAELISSVLQILTIAGGAIINVAGGVVVNGGTPSGGAGTGGKGSNLKSSTKVGSVDDVAQALGTSADDVINTFGSKASYTVDDIAKGLGSSVDDVVKNFGGSISATILSKGGSLGKLSGLGKGLGIAGTVLQVGSAGVEAHKDFSSGDNKGGTEAIGGGLGSVAGGIGGAKLGATAGAALGTVVPGVGNVIGAGLGTIAGAIIGSLGGDWMGRKVSGSIYDGVTKDVKDNDNIKTDNVTVTSENINMNGELQIPSLRDYVRQGNLSSGIDKDVINNQIQIDDSVTMQPQFSVSPPNVNVNVNVDRNDRIIKQTTILNPGQGETLNNWYQRTSAQYGGTAK